MTAEQLAQLQLPPGFTINLVTDQVPNARQMALSERGTLYIGTRRAGSVYAIRNALQPTAKELVISTLATDLTMPSGLAMLGKDLYVGAVDRVLRFADVDQQSHSEATFTVITDTLPSEKHHGWKYLGVGPDQQLYVPVGAPCNICLSKDPRFAALLRMNPSDGSTQIIAHGIRNTVGFDWHPTTGQLWFSDNGRDMLGDDVPHEEINRLHREGLHFGYPFVHAGTVADPEFGKDTDPSNFEPPALTLQAHSAALGIKFYAAKQFPAKYRRALFVAEHGSWNRSAKVGFRISVALHVGTAQDSTPSYSQLQPFITGWLQGQEAWGRPNDVLVAPDGSLLIADDKAGAIYRVHYAAEQRH